MAALAGGPSFLEALHGRVEASIDACTRCGKCVTACPMVEPAGIDTGRDGAAAPAIVTGLIQLVTGGTGTPEAERWSQVCTNSGKCIPACEYGVNPRFLVNMARIAAKARAGEPAVRRGAAQYFTSMARNTRVISRLQLAPEVLERVAPPLRAADEYERTPDIVFYTGCNVIKTPHIALLVLEVLDRLGVSYEVMGGTASCCGIQQFKRGDAKTAGRVSYNTIERLGRPDRLAGRDLVSELPDTAGRGGAAGVSGIIWSDAVRVGADRGVLRGTPWRSAPAVRAPGREAGRPAGALGGAGDHDRDQADPARHSGA